MRDRPYHDDGEFVHAPARDRAAPEAPMTHPKYRPDIDGLRALAVASVVVYHAFPSLLPGGFTGVDVFFVISGFLITTIIADNLAAGRFSFLTFYKRRVRRIFPALILVVGFTLAVGSATLLTDERDRLEWHVAAAAGFVSNFQLWRESGYFDTIAESKPLLHLWSLAIEEQYYLLWPAALWFAARRRWRAVTLTAACAAASFALNVALVGSDSTAAFYSPATRFWELLAGALLAQGRAPLAALSPRGRDLLACGGLASLAAGFALIDSARAFPGFWALLPVAGAAALIGAGAQPRVNRALLAHPALVWVGLISYPLYLWHWPLLTFVRLLEGGSTLARIAAVAAAVALAAVTQRILEPPLRFGARGGWKAAGLTLALLALGATAVGMNVVRAARSVAPDLPPAEAALTWRESDKSDPACKRMFGRRYSYCKLDVEREPTVALLGDSFANGYYPGLAQVYAARGETLLMAGAPGCPPLLDVTSSVVGKKDECRGRTSDAVKEAAQKPTIRTVLLGANWSLYITGKRLRYADPWRIRPVEGGEASNVEVFERQLLAAIDLLDRAGKRVILLKQTPELPFDAAQCLRQATPCTFDAAAARDFLADYERVFDAVARQRPQARVVDLAQAVCGDKTCTVMQDGLPLFRDDMHLSRPGSDVLAARIAGQL